MKGTRECLYHLEWIGKWLHKKRERSLLAEKKKKKSVRKSQLRYEIVLLVWYLYILLKKSHKIYLKNNLAKFVYFKIPVKLRSYKSFNGLSYFILSKKKY